MARDPRGHRRDRAAPAAAGSVAAGTPARPYILVVEGDNDLSYLLARYAKRGGFGFRMLRAAGAPGAGATVAATGPATLWLPSLERLEAVRPRESGLVGDDSPVIVCTSDETAAHSLGADFCALHPLTYVDFLAALGAVGLPVAAGPEDPEGKVDTESPERSLSSALETE